MSERSNSLEHKVSVQKHGEQLKKQWNKVGFLNLRIMEECGNNPTEQQIAEFESKYEKVFGSLGPVIERNLDEGDNRVFKWKNVK